MEGNFLLCRQSIQIQILIDAPVSNAVISNALKFNAFDTCFSIRSGRRAD